MFSLFIQSKPNIFLEEKQIYRINIYTNCQKYVHTVKNGRKNRRIMKIIFVIYFDIYESDQESN